jgi:uncharacterized protein
MALINPDKLKKVKHKANGVLNRIIDQHINLAVTGLSRSGKTAFITSLVNQLVNENSNSQLSFFDVVHQGRFVGAKRVPQKHFHIARFDYDGAITSLEQIQPSWPEPTVGISEMRLAIRYRPKNSLLKYFDDMATLYVDITDYPGEWLLDLPLLNQTFEEWSEQMHGLLKQAPRKQHAQAFINRVEQLDPFQMVDEDLLKELSLQYTELLHYFRHELGLSVIQPGRFILPGELANAPILQFFPYLNFANIDANAYQNAGDDSLIGMLRARFIEYKERVVRQFYQQHFLRFDRQIVLADCLTPLNKGVDSFADLQLAISLILESFNYGKTSLLNRLFTPKIDKLLFAATKADHVTPEQHGNVVSLLNQLVYQTKQQLSFENLTMKTLAIAGVKATSAGKTLYQGQSMPVIKGVRLADHQLLTLFPGTVPSNIPTQAYWQQSQFKFVEFAPPVHENSTLAINHLRMDQVLQFLLGDKLK